MPTWSEVLTEFKDSKEGNKPPDCDQIRRKYLVELSLYTKRNTILYATRFLNPGDAPSNLLSIVLEDLQGLMEVVYGTKGKQLDLILHSPGGSIDAADTLVTYLRSKFSNIRVIVPMYAYSAATMMACAADQIMLGKHSFLGPIDPQILVRNEHGSQFVPAQSILDQFEKAVKACSDQRQLPAWVPMLRLYGPHLLDVCEKAKMLATEMVSTWLKRYMLKKLTNREEKAKEIAEWLANNNYFKSHGRSISRTALAKRGMNIGHLESDQKLQDKVLSVIHATTLTFEHSQAAKIIENNRGRAFIKGHKKAVLMPQMIPQMLPVQPAPILIPAPKKSP